MDSYHRDHSRLPREARGYIMKNPVDSEHLQTKWWQCQGSDDRPDEVGPVRYRKVRTKRLYMKKHRDP